MTEVVCDSKLFTVLLKVPAVLSPRVQIITSTEEAKEGQAIDCKFRVWNDGTEAIELTRTALYDVDTGALIEKDDADLWKPNIEPGKYVERNLSSWGWSPDMPNRNWNLKVEACVRPKGLF